MVSAYYSVSSISLEWLSTGVFKAGRSSTSWTAAHLLRMFPAVSGFTLSVATSSSFHDIITACLTVGHSLLSAQWPGTLSLTISPTQHLVMTSLEQHWRHTFSPSTRTCSSSEASCMIVLYKCTITYLLAYGVCLCCRLHQHVHVYIPRAALQ